MQCYGPGMLNKLLGKLVLGFIPDFDSKNVSLFTNLGLHGALGLRAENASITRRHLSTKLFKSSIGLQFDEDLKHDLRYAFNVGIHVYIPGLGHRVVRPYLAGVIADKPELYASLGHQSGESNRGCHACCCLSKNNGDIYCPDIHCPRKTTLQKEQQQLAISYTDKMERKVPTTMPKKKSKKFCAEWGISLGMLCGWFDLPYTATRQK